ncbi:F-box only protein 48 [Anomaloglossus baeobatrachus]|uniref:F-box only protein 48 n=1 Tax=Anomaloglossus baeobatrachus TaxID=238106 RepID=UPI003F4FFD3C
MDILNNCQNTIDNLPLEMILEILKHLSLDDLLAIKQTCKHFNQILEDNDWIWRPHCLRLRTVCQSEIDEDRKQGHTWQEIVQRNYSKCVIKRKWMDGTFSNIESYEKLPPKTMCPLSAASWGEMLEAELTRETKKST